jgi:hypothetical protein
VSEALSSLLAVGTRLAHDGQWWQVAELNGPYVLLSGASGVRRVSAGHLLADPSTRLDGRPPPPPGAPARSWPGWARPNWRSCASASRTSRKCGRGSGADAPSWRRPASRARSTLPVSRCWTAMPPRPPRSGSGCPPCAAGSRTSGTTARPGWPTTAGDADGGRWPGRTRAGWTRPGRCWPTAPMPAGPPRTWSSPRSPPAWTPSTTRERCRSRRRPAPASCCARSPGAPPRSAGRRPSGRSLAARRRPTGGCARRGRASTC